MNWFDRRPEDLAAQSSPAEALEVLRACETLDARAQQILDYVFVDWLVQALSRSSDLEGVVELHQLCRIACTLLGDTPAEKEMRKGWQVIASALEAKRLAIRFAKTPPEVPLLHEEPILEMLARGEMPQSKFVEHLCLSAGRVSQILRVLELRGKIMRERRGKESWVSLKNAPVPIKASKPEPVAAENACWGFNTFGGNRRYG